MNRILLLFSAVFVMGTICETQAQFTFRTFKTVTQEATFVDREIIKDDGTRETVTEVVIKTVEVELTLTQSLRCPLPKKKRKRSHYF